MAENIFTEILEEKPNGTINLLGYSMGGLIAFELSKKLESCGFPVNLFLIDSNIIRDIKQREMTDLEYDLEFDNSKVHPEIFTNNLKSHHIYNSKILSLYEPEGVLNANIICFEAQDNPVSNMKHWSLFTNGQVRINSIFGNHFQALNNKNFKKIKDELILIINSGLP